MEKRFHGKEDHPSSPVNLSERLYEKKIDPFAPESWADNRARACSDCLSLAELSQLGDPKVLYGEKLAQLGGRPY